MHPALTATLQEALYLALWVSLPPLGVALGVGLVVSLLQSVGQLSEQALNAIPRALAVGVSLALTGSWMGSQLVAFTARLFERLPELAR